MPSPSVALTGLLPSSKRVFKMGTEPTAAALCRGSCPRVSFTRALHLLAIKVRTVEILALELAKCSAFFGYH